MVEENFVLKWKSHTDQMRQTLHQMMITESLTDVTLVSSDQLYFKAHKVVIGAGSNIFNEIVNKTQVNDSFIFMRGITGKDLKSILSFIYLGEVSIDHERMNEFLEIARDLSIRGLSTKENETNTNKHHNSISHTYWKLGDADDASKEMPDTEQIQTFPCDEVKEEDIDEHEEERVIRNSQDPIVENRQGITEANMSNSSNTGQDNENENNIASDEQKPVSLDLPQRGRSRDKLSGISKESKCVSPSRVEIHPARNNGILLRIDGNMFSSRTRAQKFVYMKCKTAGCEVQCRYLRESQTVDKLEGEHNHLLNIVHGYKDSA